MTASGGLRLAGLPLQTARKGLHAPMRTHYLATKPLDELRLAKDLDSSSFLWSEAYSDYVIGLVYTNFFLTMRARVAEEPPAHVREATR
jgi:hypothetical protein